jgi:methylmalonyl-CoA mutase
MPDETLTTAPGDRFETPSREAWEALARKAAGTLDLAELASLTDDGIAIQPLYVPADCPSPAAVPGMPASAPAIRSLIAEPAPEAANDAIHEEIAGGADEILLQIEAPGQAGIRLEAPGDLERVLGGVGPGGIAIHLRHATVPHSGTAPRHLFVDLADWWDRAGEGNVLTGGFGIDTIGAAAAGHIPMSWLDEDELAWDTGAMGYALSGAPGALVLCASGLPYHEAGASEAQELAAMLASTVAHLRICEQHGTPPADAAPRIGLELAADADLFLTIAKLRAARLMWARLGEECGFDVRPRLAVQTSARMMCASDPETNIVRTTMAVLGAGIGGADAVTILPFTHALGRPRPDARRIARNTQHILGEEAHIGMVADPAAGAPAVEILTEALCETAWGILSRIEARGGMVAALTSGWLQREIAAVRGARASALAAGRRVLVGATAYRPEPARPSAAGTWDVPAVAGRSATALAPIRLEDGVAE